MEIFWLLDDMAGNPGNTIHLLHPLDGPTNTLISPDENERDNVKKKNDKRPVYTRLGRKKNSSTHQQNGTVFPNEVPCSTEPGFAARWLDGCKELDPAPVPCVCVCRKSRGRSPTPPSVEIINPLHQTQTQSTRLRYVSTMPTRSINHTRRHKKERILDPGNHKSRSSKKTNK